MGPPPLRSLALAAAAKRGVWRRKRTLAERRKEKEKKGYSVGRLAKGEGGGRQAPFASSFELVLKSALPFSQARERTKEGGREEGIGASQGQKKPDRPSGEDGKTVKELLLALRAEMVPSGGLGWFVRPSVRLGCHLFLHEQGSVRGAEGVERGARCYCAFRKRGGFGQQCIRCTCRGESGDVVQHESSFVLGAFWHDMCGCYLMNSLSSVVEDKIPSGAVSCGQRDCCWCGVACSPRNYCCCCCCCGGSPPPLSTHFARPSPFR